jgi:hypothetical protein
MDDWPQIMPESASGAKWRARKIRPAAGPYNGFMDDRSVVIYGKDG